MQVEIQDGFLKISWVGVRRLHVPHRALLPAGVAADTLLQDMRQTLLGQSALAANTHSGQGTEDVGQLLR